MWCRKFDQSTMYKCCPKIYYSISWGCQLYLPSEWPSLRWFHEFLILADWQMMILVGSTYFVATFFQGKFTQFCGLIYKSNWMGCWPKHLASYWWFRNLVICRQQGFLCTIGNGFTNGHCELSLILPEFLQFFSSLFQTFHFIIQTIYDRIWTLIRKSCFILLLCFVLVHLSSKLVALVNSLMVRSTP